MNIRHHSVSAVLILLICLSTIHITALPTWAEPEVGLAILRDGPSWTTDLMVERTKLEIKNLTSGDYNVIFLEGEEFNANWDVGRTRVVLENALNDSRVDLIIASGALTAIAAIERPGPLPKPVMTGLTLASDAIGFKVDPQGYSLKPNLTSVFIPNRVANDFKAMKQLFKTKTVHLLVDAKLLEGWPGALNLADSNAGRVGFTRARLVPMSDQAEETLSRLTPDVETVYLTPPQRMSGEEQKKLIAGFISRRIKTFSMKGEIDVQRGILAGLAPDAEQRLSRRIALNIQAILSGASTRELSSIVEVEERLTINAQTAQAIGFWPDFKISAEAKFIDLAIPKGDKALDLIQAMDIAIKQNVDLEVRKARTEGYRQDRNKAASYFWPQVTARGQYVQVDKDRADASMGMQPIYRTTVGAEASWALFNDEIISSFRAAGLSAEAAAYEEEIVRLDIMQDAANAFLDNLSAMALFRIKTDNLRLIEKNLELARGRVRVGISGREEVYRLESEEALRRSQLMEAESQVDQARVALNRILGEDQDNLWNLQDVRVNDAETFYLYSRLTQMLDNMQGVRKLTSYLLILGQDSAPEIKALDQAMEAGRIMYEQKKRKFFMPDLSAKFEYDYEVDKKSGKTAPFSSTAFTRAPYEADDHEWSVGVVLSVPIFQGGGRLADSEKALSELNGLKAQKRRANELIAQRIRSAMLRMNYSSPNIDLTKLAAENAGKNLEVIQDKYARGKASLIDLLDAQTESLVQQQSAALAEYQFIKDYIEMQRALGWFEFGRSRSELDQWVVRMNNYINSSTPPKRGGDRP